MSPFQMQEEDAVIIEEINHGYLNDGYDECLYEDDGKKWRHEADKENQTRNIYKEQGNYRSL